MDKLLYGHVFISLRYTHRSGIAIYECCLVILVFHLLRNCQTVFHRHYSILYSHQHVEGFQLFYIIPNICHSSDDNHLTGCKVAIHCGVKRVFQAPFLGLS